MVAFVMKYFSRFKLYLYGFAVALILSGCGVGTTPLMLDAGANQTNTQTVKEFVAHMVTTMGEKEAFDAIYLAYEKGYSLAQIAEGGLNNRIGADGTITDAGGAVLIPEPRLSVNEIITSNIGATADIDMIRTWLGEEAAKNPDISAEGNSLFLMVGLMQGGYSAEQIVEAYLFGYTLAWSDEYNSFAIYDETGKLVSPALKKDTTTFTAPTSGDSSYYLTTETILGSWSNPHTPIEGGSYFPACAYTFNSDETGSRTCEVISGSQPFFWDIKCNVVGIDNSSWNVTSPTTMQIVSRGTTLVLSKN